MQFFSWRHPFQTKLLFFQTIESVKRAFATGAGSEKPVFLHALFLENEKQNRRKLWGNVFPLRHMQKLSSFRGKKKKKKTGLKVTYFINAGTPSIAVNCKLNIGK